MADFDKKTWVDFVDTIGASDLNRMENGIEKANSFVVELDPNDDGFTYDNLRRYLDNKATVIFGDRDESATYDNRYTLCALMVREGKYIAAFSTASIDPYNMTAECAFMIFYANSIDEQMVEA